MPNGVVDHAAGKQWSEHQRSDEGLAISKWGYGAQDGAISFKRCSAQQSGSAKPSQEKKPRAPRWSCFIAGLGQSTGRAHFTAPKGCNRPGIARGPCGHQTIKQEPFWANCCNFDQLGPLGRGSAVLSVGSRHAIAPQHPWMLGFCWLPPPCCSPWVGLPSTSAALPWVSSNSC